MSWREKGVSPRLVVSPRNVFFVILTLMFISLSCWSFASPLIASPDEQAHVLRAYALDHGDLGSATTPPSKVLENVVVPDTLFYSTIYPVCWQTHPEIPATCSAPWPTSSASETTATYVDHYPPLYYFFVGSATYISHQKNGIYLMRLVSSLMSALMLALSAYSVARWSKRRSLYLGIYVLWFPRCTSSHPQ